MSGFTGTLQVSRGDPLRNSRRSTACRELKRKYEGKAEDLERGWSQKIKEVGAAAGQDTQLTTDARLVSHTEIFRAFFTSHLLFSIS